MKLVSHPLPVAWDGRKVAWSRWGSTDRIVICGTAKPERCDCGSTRRPFTARGLRDPPLEKQAAADALPRIGSKRTPLVYPVFDLHAARCPDCGQVEVWDMESDEWWTLDDDDYGPEGSTPPSEWQGGLFDLL